MASVAVNLLSDLGQTSTDLFRSPEPHLRLGQETRLDWIKTFLTDANTGARHNIVSKFKNKVKPRVGSGA